MLRSVILFSILFFSSYCAKAQNVLPDITVKGTGGKAIISWRNGYNANITNISIQRSYDSLRNFTSIASVLSPQSAENGYLDAQPPYNKMYYRVFVSFEGGSYVYSPSKIPVLEQLTEIVKTADGKDSVVNVDEVTEPIITLINPLLDTNTVRPAIKTSPVQSKFIFTLQEEVILQLPGVEGKVYEVKFYNDKNKMIIHLKKVSESYLIIDKVNFKKSGTYRFEILEDGIIIDKNVVTVPKDSKK